MEPTSLRTPRDIATPSSRGIISATWQLIQGRLWPLIDEALVQDKNMASFTVAWPGTIVVSTDSERDKEVLKYPRYSEKIKGGHGWDTFARICFGWSNLIMSSGEQHRKILKALNPLFSKTTVRDRYYSELIAVTQKTVVNWANKEEGITLLDAALEHSCRSVTTCFLGKEAAESPLIIQAVQNLMAVFWDNAQLKPYALINLIGRKIFGKCCNLDGYWSSHQILIDAIENAPLNGGFISQLSDEAFSTDEVIDNMKMLYFAGTETTGSLITTVLGHLAVNEGEQQKLTQELSELDELNYDTLHSLKRLRAVIYESLRLVPPIPIQVREVQEEKYSYFIDHFHRLRDPALAGENPDQFDPDRFFENESLYLDVDKVFGGGLTPCIGKHFALTETMLLIASIMQQGKVSLMDGDPNEVIKEAGAHLSPDLKIKIHLKTD